MVNNPIAYNMLHFKYKNHVLYTAWKVCNRYILTHDIEIPMLRLIKFVALHQNKNNFQQKHKCIRALLQFISSFALGHCPASTLIQVRKDSLFFEQASYCRSKTWSHSGKPNKRSSFGTVVMQTHMAPNDLLFSCFHFW